MRLRDTTLSAAIFVLVVLGHAGVVAAILLGPRGCQESLASVVPFGPERDAPEERPVRLNLTLSDRVVATEPAMPAGGDEPRGDEAPAALVDEEPASRLTFPSKKEEEARLLAEEQEREREREAARRAEEEAAKRRLEEERKARLLADQREAARLAEEATRLEEEEAAERKRAEAEALAERREAERVAKEKALAERRKREAERVAKEKEVEKALAEKRKREAERVAREKEEERLRQVAARREKKKREEEEAARRREAEEVVRRIEKAKVVASQAPAPEVIKPNLVGVSGSGGGASAIPAVVSAKPANGSGEKPAVADMGAYRASVQKMIRNRWTIPRGLVVENHPEVVVRIDRSGRVVYSRSNRKSGIPEIDRSAINAVRIGSRLIPLPPGYEKDVYEVTVKFQID